MVPRPIHEVRVDKKRAWVSRAAKGFFQRARAEFTWGFLSKGRFWPLAGSMLLERGKVFILRKLERLLAAREARRPGTALGRTGRKEAVLLVVEGRQKANRRLRVGTKGRRSCKLSGSIFFSKDQEATHGVQEGQEPQGMQLHIRALLEERRLL